MYTSLCTKKIWGTKNVYYYSVKQEEEGSEYEGSRSTVSMQQYVPHETA